MSDAGSLNIGTTLNVVSKSTDSPGDFLRDPPTVPNIGPGPVVGPLLPAPVSPPGPIAPPGPVGPVAPRGDEN
ncbi:hypothetical protein NXZ84_10835 [Mechercharimyces sp. CAU 1602]|nr:hypothetical protein [Mechercharimyces sp. CAU 1602]